MYLLEDSIAGLQSNDPVVILDSAIWLGENPHLCDVDLYTKTCDTLYAAASEDADCVQYIDSRCCNILLRTQLFAKVVGESQQADVVDEASKALEKIIEYAVSLKTSDTDTVAQIYSCLKESGLPLLHEKAKRLL